MINPVNASVLSATHKIADGLKPVVDKPDIKNSGLGQVQDRSDTSSVSTLARQLADSAVRAEAREKEMSHGQLYAYAMRTHDKLFMLKAETWPPATDDPELRERARQAAHYVISACQGDYSVKNPFSDLTREQAALIGYDDAGPYTKFERKAALWHGGRLEQQWRVGLFARSDEENRQFGTRIGFYTECLTHHKSLPIIEQVQSGGLEYEARLGRWIAEEVEGLEPTDRLLTLFEVLARMGLPEFKKKHAEASANQAVQAASKAMTAPAATAQEAAPKQPASEKPTSIDELTTLRTSSLSPDVFPSPVAAERNQPCRVAR
jgi:hypothetical protein